MECDETRIDFRVRTGYLGHKSHIPRPSVMYSSGGSVRGGHGQSFRLPSFVVLCDGTEAAARRIARALRNDPGTGVMHHADAGYELARRCAEEQGLDLPMLRE